MIYDTFYQPEQIDEAFAALQAEMEEVIADRIKDTQTLLENFDEDVHDRLKLRLTEVEAASDKLGRWFWAVTRYALNDNARFDDQAHTFSLSQPPQAIASLAPVGRYQLIRGAAQLRHKLACATSQPPLGEWSITIGLNASTPPATLKLDYAKYGTRVSVVENLRGQAGWLQLTRLEVTAFEGPNFFCSLA